MRSNGAITKGDGGAGSRFPKGMRRDDPEGKSKGKWQGDY
ncbi:hypothetical protein CULT_1820008 [[Clostridium] ultunense Esp]|nr:hypothetical protein CULT_1820008 [[Clostridium] ultunense Esp]